MYSLSIPKAVYPFAANTYVIRSEDEVAVIDPTVPPEALGITDCKIKYVLLTHGHFDHILTLDEFVSLGAVIIVSEGCNRLIRDSSLNCFARFFSKDRKYEGEATVVCDGDIITLGDETLRVIATPGHTEGSVCYLMRDAIFVGDTIFAGGGFGRYDLPTANGEELFRSIDRLCELDGGLTVYPGHGEPTTILEYKNDFGKYC